MPLLLSPWKRTTHEEPAEADLDNAIVEVRRPDPASMVDRLLVLRPTEGGLAFHLYGFPDVESANDYVQNRLRLEAQQGVIAFWALHGRPSTGEPVDAVVIVRDPYHAGVVQIYSFVDMDAAQEFVRDEFRNGMDLNLILVYWAQSVDIDRPPELAPSVSTENAYFRMSGVASGVEAPPQPPRPAAVPGPSAPSPRRKEHQTSAASNQAAAAPAKPVQAPTKEPDPEAGTDGATQPSWLSRTTQGIIAWPGWDGLVPRMVLASLLNDDMYERTCDERHATGRARFIVALAVFAAGFGALNSGIMNAFSHLVFAALGWAAFGMVVYGFGTLVAGGRVGRRPFRRLVRTLGIAASPALLLVFGIIPVYGAIPVLAVYVWLFLTTTHAITPALELDSNSSVITAAFGILTLFAVAEVLPVLVA